MAAADGSLRDGLIRIGKAVDLAREPPGEIVRQTSGRNGFFGRRNVVDRQSDSRVEQLRQDNCTHCRTRSNLPEIKLKEESLYVRTVACNSRRATEDLMNNIAPEPSPLSGEFPEANSPDFQFAVKALVAAYQPVIEDELNRLKSQPAEDAAPAQSLSCKEELLLANRIFESFM